MVHHHVNTDITLQVHKENTGDPARKRVGGTPTEMVTFEPDLKAGRK